MHEVAIEGCLIFFDDSVMNIDSAGIAMRNASRYSPAYPTIWMSATGKPLGLGVTAVVRAKGCPSLPASAPGLR